MPEILIVDRIIAKPRQARAVRDVYLNEYAPGARSRGLTLRSQLISPPFELKHDDRTNILCFTWSLEGPQAWWSILALAWKDEAVVRFWQRLDPLIVHRERSYFGDAARA